MSRLRVGVLSMWLSCAVSVWAQDPCRHPKPSVQEVPEGVEVLEDLKARLLPVLNAAEAQAVKAVKICSPNMIGIQNVFATVRPDTGVPLVVFGFDAQHALREVGLAVAISRIPSVHRSYLEGYLRYRATPLRFAEVPMSAKEFAVRLGGSETAAQIQSMTDMDVNVGNGAGAALILFVLAHEFAHHVYGDVRLEYQSPEIQRQAETRADSWAATKMLQMGIDVAVPTMSMLLLNAIESKTAFSRSIANHPPALERALAVVAESERVLSEQPGWIERYLAPISTPTTLAADMQAYKANSKRLREVFATALADENRIRTDNDFLIRTASAGSTKDRITLAHHYARGDRPGLPKDLPKARFWMYMAAVGSAPYEYDYRADAQYAHGFYQFSPGGDQAKGCAALRQAAGVMHLNAGVLLDRLTKDGAC